MPADITTLQNRLVALNEMIASGTRSTTLGDQTITFNTTASLITARDDLVKQIAAEGVASGTSTARPRQTYAFYTGRGF
jgi:hypothetical protein